jgi:hypothetical protein
MRQSSLYIVCTLVLLLLSGIFRDLPAKQGASARKSGQPRSSPSGPPPGPQALVVKATVDRQKIVIGQPVQLMLEASVAGHMVMSWPPLDSLPHFEWMEKGKVDSVIHSDGISYRQYLTVTSFDSGTWAIPRLPFIAGNKKYFTDSVRITVGYSKFDPGQDYHDIKDIIDVPNPFAKWIGWMVAAVVLVSLILVVWLVRKKKMLAIFQTPPARRLSPYEEAIRQLDELKEQRLAEKGPVKTYYTRLNDILRLFILERLGITSLAETNEELIGQIRSLPLPPEAFDELSETLRMSDFVKFAKYQPGISENERSFTVIRASVEQLNKIGLPEEAAEIGESGKGTALGKPA